MLEHLRLELRILHRLANQIGPRIDEPIEPAGIGIFGRGLGFQLLPRVGLEQPLGRQRPQFAIGRHQVHFPVANLAGLLPPAVEPLVDHQGVLGLVDHVDEQRRRKHPPAARQVVLGIGPDHERLRRDAERPRRECRRRIDRLAVAAAGLQEQFSLGCDRALLTGIARPYEPDLLDPEVVACRHREPQRVGVEQHLAGRRWIDQRYDGGRIVARSERDRQRPATLESVAIPPADRERPLVGQFHPGTADHGSRRRHRSAVDGRRSQIAVGRGHKRHPAPLHGPEHAAADVLPERILSLQIVGQPNLGLHRRDLRPEHRLEYEARPCVSHRQGELGRLELARQLEGEGTVDASRAQRRPATDPSHGRVGPPLRLLGEGDTERRRLALRHDQPFGQIRKPGERVARDGSPGGQEPGPRVGRRAGKDDSDGECRRDRHRRERQPEAMPRAGQGGTEVVRHRPRCHLVDRGLAERPRPGDLGARLPPHDLDDPEQLVAETGKPPRDQPGDLIQAAVVPDPAMHRERNRRGGRHGAERDRQPHPAGRLHEAVETEEQQIGDHHAAQGAGDRLDELDPPDETAKLPQPAVERDGQRQRRLSSNQAGTLSFSNAHHGFSG